MADGKVTIPPDSTGKNIDTTELIRPDTTVVERQRVALADDILVDAHAQVKTSRELTVTDATLHDCLIELRRIRVILELSTGVEVSAEDVLRGVG